MAAPKSPGQQAAEQGPQVPGSILLQQITTFFSPQCVPLCDLHPQIYLPVLNGDSRQGPFLGRADPRANFGFKSRGALGIVEFI